MRGREAGRGELVRPVDHLSDLSAQQPWRNAAFIAATVATVELAILLVVGIIASASSSPARSRRRAIRSPSRRRRSSARRRPLRSNDNGQPQAKPLIPRRQTSVIVLNGNGISGAAATAAESVRSRQYLIGGTGNAPRTNFSRSVVMYRPGFEGEARRLARDLGAARVSARRDSQARTAGRPHRAHHRPPAGGPPAARFSDVAELDHARACRREHVERTPVWFMRQAGRSLPEYRAIRKRHNLFEVCNQPELCAEVTLQPVRRHGVDAAVMFADIMLPSSAWESTSSWSRTSGRSSRSRSRAPQMSSASGSRIPRRRCHSCWKPFASSAPS